MKEKIVYNYDADTKIYIGSEVCNKDPLDGGYLIPANCTETAPKLEDNKIPVFENGDWVNKSNNVRKYRVIDNQPVEIKELGDFDYILTDEQYKEIQFGKLVKIENNEIVIYDKEKTTEDLIRIQQSYLNSTDWYVARYAETGKEIPEDIKSKRQAAREEIEKLKL